MKFSKLHNSRAILSRCQATLNYGWYTRHPFLLSFEKPLRKSISKRICHLYTKDVIYFRVPKCASSTIVSTIGSCELGNKIPRAGYKSYYNNLPSLHVIERCKKFTFVRNPYTRILSAYNDKIKKAKFAEKGNMDIFFKNGNPVSFEDFLFILTDGNIFLDIHWAPQSKILNLKIIDFIGKVENFDKDFQMIMNEIGFDSFELQFKQNHATNSEIEQISRSNKRLIENLYSDDFNNLPYD